MLLNTDHYDSIKNVQNFINKQISNKIFNYLSDSIKCARDNLSNQVPLVTMATIDNLVPPSDIVPLGFCFGYLQKVHQGSAEALLSEVL